MEFPDTPFAIVVAVTVAFLSFGVACTPYVTMLSSVVVYVMYPAAFAAVHTRPLRSALFGVYLTSVFTDLPSPATRYIGWDEENVMAWSLSVPDGWVFPPVTMSAVLVMTVPSSRVSFATR